MLLSQADVHKQGSHVTGIGFQVSMGYGSRCAELLVVPMQTRSGRRDRSSPTQKVPDRRKTVTTAPPSRQACSSDSVSKDDDEDKDS